MTKHNSHEWKKEEDDDDVDVDGDDEATADVPRLPLPHVDVGLWRPTSGRLSLVIHLYYLAKLPAIYSDSIGEGHQGLGHPLSRACLIKMTVYPALCAKNLDKDPRSLAHV